MAQPSAVTRGELGWPTGLEPVTFGATIRCSAVELRPPRRRSSWRPRAAACTSDGSIPVSRNDAASATVGATRRTVADRTRPHRSLPTCPGPVRTRRYLGATREVTIAPRTPRYPEPTVTATPATTPGQPRSPLTTCRFSPAQRSRSAPRPRPRARSASPRRLGDRGRRPVRPDVGRRLRELRRARSAGTRDRSAPRPRPISSR